MSESKLKIILLGIMLIIISLFIANDNNNTKKVPEELEAIREKYTVVIIDESDDNYIIQDDKGEKITNVFCVEDEQLGFLSKEEAIKKFNEFSYPTVWVGEPVKISADVEALYSSVTIEKQREGVKVSYTIPKGYIGAVYSRPYIDISVNKMLSRSCNRLEYIMLTDV